MDTFSKSEMKRLRAAAGMSWERELTAALDLLLDSFQKWKAGEIDAFELSELIHQFHDGAARDLDKFYIGAKADHAAGRGVAHGWIERDELPPKLLEKLESVIAFHEVESMASFRSGARDRACFPL